MPIAIEVARAERDRLAVCRQGKRDREAAATKALEHAEGCGSGIERQDRGRAARRERRGDGADRPVLALQRERPWICALDYGIQTYARAENSIQIKATCTMIENELNGAGSLIRENQILKPVLVHIGDRDV